MSKGKSGAFSVTMKEGAKLKKTLEGYDKKCENVLKRTASDFRTRGPGWIAQGVRKHYNITTSDVNRSVRSKNGTSISIAGREVAGVTLMYKDRMLTTPRFNQNPKERPKEKDYRISVQIVKGQKSYLPEKAFLAKALGEYPFQRAGDGRKPLHIIKAIAVPQMIDGERANETVQQILEEKLESRVANHIKQALK